MMQTVKKFINAAFLGLAVEAVYFAVIEYANFYWTNLFSRDSFLYVSLLYIALVGIAVSIVIKRYYKRTNTVIGYLKPLAALFAGVWLHYMILEHSSVVYYRMHGVFYPPSDDLGFFFFMAYLSMVYLLWIPEVLYYLIKKLIKGGNENAL